MMADAQPTPAASPPPQQQATATGQVDEKTWALLAHLSGLSGLVTGGIGTIVGPLVVWLIGKDKGAFIDRHGKEALNFGITAAIALWVAGILIFVIIGILLLPIVAIYWIIMVIMATVKASNGEEFQYPITFRFIK